MPLVSLLCKQGTEFGINIEIIIWDDASSVDFSFLNDREDISFFRSPENLGRAKTRTLLAEKAVFPYLLFLDADVMPANESFLKQYAEWASPDTILVGGIRYAQKKPEPNQFFRWFYGKAREELSAEKRRKNPYAHFMTGNFFIPTALFFRFPLPNFYREYGHEDTLLGYTLQQGKVPIRHMDNPVYHLGLDDNELFFSKSKEAVLSLWHLKKQGYQLPTKLNASFDILEKYQLTRLFALGYPLFEVSLIKKIIFSGNFCSLFLFDLFKLSFYCKISLESGK
jgi:glycosyltransferase involved in cell wall biosynthesis